MLRLYSSILFVFTALTLFAQNGSKETTVGDSVRSKFIPTGIRIGTDALSIARNYFDDSFKGWEVNADVDFYRYYLAVDVGSWSRKFTSDSGPYESDGNYWRVGADVNFLVKDPDRNVLFFGIRYGHGTFTETFVVETTDPIWGTFSTTYVNPDLTASWYEVTSGIKVKMWRFFWMGYTVRFKFGLNTSESGATMIPSDVPGFGRTHKNETWGFNYQIIFRIPFKKGDLGPLKK